MSGSGVSDFERPRLTSPSTLTVTRERGPAGKELPCTELLVCPTIAGVIAVPRPRSLLLASLQPQLLDDLAARRPAAMI